MYLNTFLYISQHCTYTITYTDILTPLSIDKRKDVIYELVHKIECQLLFKTIGRIEKARILSGGEYLLATQAGKHVNLQLKNQAA